MGEAAMERPLVVEETPHRIVIEESERGLRIQEKPVVVERPGMKVEFITTAGARKTIEFKQQPLQMEIHLISPMMIKAVYPGPGMDQGVQAGWQIYSVNGESFGNRMFPDIWQVWETAIKGLTYVAPTITMSFETDADTVKTVEFTRRPLGLDYGLMAIPITISEVYPGPAMEAGVLPGWKVKAVNGVSTEMLNSKEVVQLMQKHVSVLKES